METISAKPSKAELLKELESIRDSLLTDGDSTPSQDPLPAPAPASAQEKSEAPTAQKIEDTSPMEKPQSLLKKSYLEIDESDYDFELKIPSHAKQDTNEAEEESNANVEHASESANMEAEHTEVEEVEALPPVEDVPMVEVTISEETHEAEESIASEEPEESDDIAELAQMLAGDSDDEHDSFELDSEHTQIEASEEASNLPPLEEDDDVATLSEPVQQSELPTMEVPAINDYMLAEHKAAMAKQEAAAQNNPAPKPLPGQQSLFDDTVVPAQEAAPVSAQKVKPVNVRPPVKAPITPPKPVENPFLPQHIKAKLERERTLYEQEINAAVQTNSAKHFYPSSAKPLSRVEPMAVAEKPAVTEHEKLIDELVSEYLPKIEAALRERLRESLSNTHKEMANEEKASAE